MLCGIVAEFNYTIIDKALFLYYFYKSFMVKIKPEAFTPSTYF